MLEQVVLKKKSRSTRGAVYTFGYGRFQSFLKVKQKLREVIPHDRQIILVDVRHWPYTRWGNADWNKNNLKDRVGGNGHEDLKYCWFGGHVGNPRKFNQSNYHDWMVRERLGHLLTFKNWIYRWIKEGKIPAIFCACYANAERVCHRFPLADYLKKELKVDLVHL